MARGYTGYPDESTSGRSDPLAKTDGVAGQLHYPLYKRTVPAFSTHFKMQQARNQRVPGQETPGKEPRSDPLFTVGSDRVPVQMVYRGDGGESTTVDDKKPVVNPWRVGELDREPSSYTLLILQPLSTTVLT